MEIKPIRTESDYEDTLIEIQRLFYAEPGTPEYDKLEVLTTLVEAYEEKHYAIPLPDPIDAIEYHMERLGFTRKSLEPFIGGAPRVSEILNRKRPLTMRMIRKLNKGLGIPIEVLAQEYELNQTPKDFIVVGSISYQTRSRKGLTVQFTSTSGVTSYGDKPSLRYVPSVRTDLPGVVNNFSYQTGKREIIPWIINPNDEKIINKRMSQ